MTYSESVHILLDCLRYYNQAESNRLVGDEAREEPRFQNMASTADSHKAPDTIDFNWQRSGNKTLRGTKGGSSLCSQTAPSLQKNKAPNSGLGMVVMYMQHRSPKKSNWVGAGESKKGKIITKTPLHSSGCVFSWTSDAVTSYRGPSSQGTRQSVPAAGSQLTIGQRILCRS